jgi:hypothetical protein
MFTVCHERGFTVSIVLLMCWYVVSRPPLDIIRSQRDGLPQCYKRNMTVVVGMAM